MGYLTPLLIRNDCLDMVERDPESLRKIVSACMDSQPRSISMQRYRTRKWYRFWEPKQRVCCSASDVVNSLGAQHADDSRTIVVSGNTWCEINHEYFIRKYPAGSIFSEAEPVRMDDTMLDYLEKCAEIALEDATKLKDLIAKHRENT